MADNSYKYVGDSTGFRISKKPVLHSRNNSRKMTKKQGSSALLGRSTAFI